MNNIKQVIRAVIFIVIEIAFFLTYYVSAFNSVLIHNKYENEQSSLSPLLYFDVNDRMLTVTFDHDITDADEVVYPAGTVFDVVAISGSRDNPYLCLECVDEDGKIDSVSNYMVYEYLSEAENSEELQPVFDQYRAEYDAKETENENRKEAELKASRVCLCELVILGVVFLGLTIVSNLIHRSSLLAQLLYGPVAIIGVYYIIFKIICQI